MFPTLSFGDQEFTPQEMSVRSAKVAGAMAAIGLKEGDTIALILRNEPARLRGRKPCSLTLICFNKLRVASHLTFPFLRCGRIRSRLLPTTYKGRQHTFRKGQLTGRHSLQRRSPTRQAQRSHAE